MIVLYVFIAFILLVLGGIVLAIALVIRKEGQARAARQQILATGKAAKALVEGVGPSAKGRFVHTVRLTVRPTHGASFPTLIEVFVPPYATGVIAPGREIDVRYSESKTVVVDFEAMGYTQPN